MLQKAFSFKGRINRTEFIVSIGIFMFVGFIIMSMMMTSRDMETIGSLLSLPIIWFYLAQGAKRARDMGQSPFLCILLIAPSLIVSILPSDVSNDLQSLSGLATLGVIIWFSVVKSINNLDSDINNSNYYNPNPPSGGNNGNDYTEGYGGGHNNGSGDYTSYGQSNGQNAQSSQQYGSS